MAMFTFFENNKIKVNIPRKIFKLNILKRCVLNQ